MFPLLVSLSEIAISQVRGSLLSTVARAKQSFNADILIASLIRAHPSRSGSASQGFVSQRFRESVKQELSRLGGRQ